MFCYIAVIVEFLKAYIIFSIILICFDCKNVTSFATDLDNASGKAIDFIEYFRSYKLNGSLKTQILNYEKEKQAYKILSTINKKIYLIKVNKIKKI